MFLSFFVIMEVAFKDLKEGDYDIHAGQTHYVGTFKRHVDNLAYFDPLYAVLKYVPTPTLDWEKAVTVQNVQRKQVMDRYKKDDVFFYIGACSFDRSFLQYRSENDIHPHHFMERWDRFEMSDLYDNPYHFFYEWWNGKIDPSTLCPVPKEVKESNRRVALCEKKFSKPGKHICSQGQYFHNHRIFKKIETADSSNK
jgi:hypothetical protein